MPLPISPTRRLSWHGLATLIATCVLAVIVAPAWPGPGLSLDDAPIVSAPQLRLPFGLPLISALTSPMGKVDWLPVRDFSHWLEIHFLAADPWLTTAQTYRIVQWLLFGATAWALSWTLAALQVGLAPMWAALWLLNPSHLESLVWVSARKDLLALLLGLVATGAWLRCLRGRGARWGWLALVAFTLALGSKASLLGLPLGAGIALLLGPYEHKAPRAAWISAGGGLLISALVGWTQSEFYSSTQNDMRYSYLLIDRIRGALAGLGRGVTGWITPSVNAIDFENWGEWIPRHGAFATFGAIICLLLATLGVHALSGQRRHSTLLAIALIALVWLPSSGLLFEHRSFYSSRYLAPALVVMIAWLAVRLPTMPAAALVGWIALSGVATAYDAPHWVDGSSIFAKGLSHNPTNPSLANMLVIELRNHARETRLNDAQRTALAAAEQLLRETCDPMSAIPSPRGSLCRDYWQRIGGQAAMRAIALTQTPLNPAQTARELARMRIREDAEHGRILFEDASEWLRLQPETPALPEHRLQRVALTCLANGSTAASALLGRYVRHGLLLREDIARHAPALDLNIGACEPRQLMHTSVPR